jgi:hypothetical protein
MSVSLRIGILCIGSSFLLTAGHEKSAGCYLLRFIFFVQNTTASYFGRFPFSIFKKNTLDFSKMLSFSIFVIPYIATAFSG